MNNLRQALRSDLESQTRAFGTGWISGVGAISLAIMVLGAVLSSRFPGLFSEQHLHPVYQQPWVSVLMQGMMLVSFLLACISLVLRQTKVLGVSAIGIVFIASLLSSVSVRHEPTDGITSFISIDWFVLNLLMTGILFIPLETFFGRLRDQPLFRDEWREDLLYFLVSSLFVHWLTYASLWPANFILSHTGWSEFRQAVVSQPLLAQVIEIMFLTDFIQYWFHRAFHQIPWLWKFHAVHHSAKKMDWLAGSRMHLFEVVGLRAFTVIPMMTFGFQEIAIQAYLLIVYLNATYLHANLKFDIEWLKPVIATARFHHWHHGIEKEAIDVNFSIHFPLFDRLFGTYYMPSKAWPSGYGIGGHPVPNGYLNQFFYPFKK